MDIIKSWSEFKTLASTKNLSMQWMESSVDYMIWMTEGVDQYNCTIRKSDPAEADQTDFETNYKDSANQPIAPKTTDRIPKILQAVASDDVSLYVYSKKEEVTGATSEINWTLTETIRLQGVNAMVKNADWGDSVDVEVGYYAPEWTLVKKFGDTVYMRDSIHWETYTYVNAAVSKLTVPLVIKFKYNQADSGTIKKVIVHYICHK